jgi:hypothetical protein
VNQGPRALAGCLGWAPELVAGATSGAATSGAATSGAAPGTTVIGVDEDTAIVDSPVRAGDQGAIPPAGPVT